MLSKLGLLMVLVLQVRASYLQGAWQLPIIFTTRCSDSFDRCASSHAFFQVTELCTGGELFDRIIAKTESAEGRYSESDAANIVHKILGCVDGRPLTVNLHFSYVFHVTAFPMLDATPVPRAFRGLSQSAVHEKRVQ